MFIAILTLSLHLPGCSSLKEKRQRVAGLRDKFGRQPQIAVCESGHNDTWQSSEWSFVLAGTDKRQLTQLLDQIENHAEQNLDAVINTSEREWL